MDGISISHYFETITFVGIYRRIIILGFLTVPEGPLAPSKEVLNDPFLPPF